MRKSFPALLALAMLPAMFVVAPTVDLPTPKPRPVAPTVRTIALHSLDASIPAPAPAATPMEYTFRVLVALDSTSTPRPARRS